RIDAVPSSAYVCLRREGARRMKGCKPAPYRLRAVDRRYLKESVKDGRQLQRVARRAHILLALDRGERIVEIMRWLGVSRMGIWHVWQRYQQLGGAADCDEEHIERSGVLFTVRSG